MSGPVIGKPPTPSDKADFAAAANLAPDKSLLRTQELAKFVFSSVAVIGTLLTGLGLFTELGEVLENSAVLFGDVPLAVAAVGTSLICASFAVWPKMSSVDLSRPDEVNRWYRQQIRRRGAWMTLSLILFSLAIGVATFTGTGEADEPENPSISASWTGLGDKAVVKLSATAEGLPEDWVMVTVVRGRPAKGDPTTIFRDRTRPGGDGKLAVAGEIGVGERFGRIESNARLFPLGDPAEADMESNLVIKRG